MADFEYDYGDNFHDGGEVADVENDDLYLDDILEALEDFGDYEDVLVDFEGDQDYDMQSG